MRITAGIGAVVVLAGVGLGLVGPASANDFSGTYTYVGGNGDQRQWVVTACEAHCARVSAAAMPDSPAYDGTASLIDGRWRMTVSRPDAIGPCPGGSHRPGISTYTWDAATLSGSVSSSTQAGCNDAPTVTPSKTFTLTKVG